MKRGDAILCIGAVVSAALLIGTRVPSHEPALTLVSIGLAAGFVLAAAANLRPTLSKWAAPATLGLACALLLVPTSTRAWLEFLPAPLAVFPLLVVFHYAYAHDISEAPRIQADRRSHPWSPVVRSLPVAIPLLIVAVTPGVLSAWLPDRLGAVFELQRAAGALLAGLVVAGALVTVVWVRRLWEREEETPAASAAPTRRPAKAGPATSTVAKRKSSVKPSGRASSSEAPR